MKIDVSTMDGYDLATALRGPDIAPKCNAEEKFGQLLKAHTAARFRFLVGVGEQVNCFVNPSSISSYDRDRLLDLGIVIGRRLCCYDHYIFHARLGAISAAKIVGARYIDEMSALADLMQKLLDRSAQLDNDR